MPTEEREFPAHIPDTLSFSLLIPLDRAAHLRFPSSAAVSWLKQLPCPTLQAAASRGCLGSTKLQHHPSARARRCPAALRAMGTGLAAGMSRTLPGHHPVFLHTLQSGAEMPFLLILVFLLSHFSSFFPFFFFFPLVVWIKGP